MHLGDSAIIIGVHLISRLLSDIQHLTHTHIHLPNNPFLFLVCPS